MEEGADTVVGEAAEATGIGFDGLDAGVEAFGERVGDGVSEVVEQAKQMGLERACGLLERLEFAARDGVIPLREEVLAAFGAILALELDEGLLVGASSRGL